MATKKYPHIPGNSDAEDKAAFDKKNNKAGAKDKTTKLSAEGKDTTKLLDEAGRIYTGNSNLNIPLERQNVNSTSSSETDSLIGTIQDSLNPSSPNYTGAISPQLQSALDKLQAGVPISSAEREQLDVLKSAQGRTTDTQDAIDRIKGGLAGLNSEENTALRDRATRAAQSTLATSIAAIQRAGAGKRNVFSGGAINKATESFGRSRLADEQEQLLKNMDVQDRRRGQYADVIGSAETREQGRRMDYTGALQTSNQNEFARQSDYTGQLGTADNNAKNRGLTATNTLGGLLQGRDAARNDASQFNIGQSNKEAAARAAGTTGIAQLTQDGKYNNKMVKIAEGGTSSSSSKRSGDGRNRATSTNGQPPRDYAQEYLDNYKKLTDEHYR